MKLATLIIILILSVNIFAQRNSNSSATNEKSNKSVSSKNENFLNRFLGNWKGEGKIMGLESKIVMSWEKVLDGKFIKLNFRNEMKTKDGKIQVFEGNAFYKANGENEYQGNWFDSGGEAHPIKAVVEEMSLNSVWGTKETKLGKTVYRLIDENKMEVVDSISLKDGNWREFGRAVYVRQ